MKNSKISKITSIINIIIAIIAAYSFVSVYPGEVIYYVMFALTIIATILNIINTVIDKRNDIMIGGDVVALIGVILYLIAGELVGLLTAILIVFSFIFKMRFQEKQ